MAWLNEKSWQQVSPYLDEALDLDPLDRERWLVALEESNPAIAAQLRHLLAVHSANCAAGFLERSPIDVNELLAGQRIGPYTLERLLGRGGMGSVWLGRRSDGKFEGQAAIKLLNRRNPGQRAAAQIKHEASLLARLSHAHIARLFDAGVRDNGQPYLILEYVEGEPIDRYCSARRLALPDRLHLFLSVLDAVAHAQAQLVVHRDIKPSNVLVTPDGTVKLLDFGVAALQSDASVGALHGLTPGYAAPEQLRGEPVSTAADVYALGALLHVLVTGEHPLGSSESTHSQLVHATLTVDPGPASGRIANATERRRVRGDLDSIITRALHRDSLQRYATAAELAADIRRFLGNFPVQARRPTRTYVARKFAQRHWGGILSVGLTILVLISATAVTILQGLEVRRQRDFARTQLARAEALNELNNYVLTDAAPDGKPFTVNELLGRAAHLLQRQRITDDNRVALLISIGRQYATQDEDQAALKFLEEAYRLSWSISSPSIRARAACALANALAKQQSSSRPEALLAEGLRELPAAAEFALDRAFCLSRGNEIALSGGDAQLAVRRAQGAIQALAEVPFDHEIAALRAEADLAEAYRDAGRYRDAIAVFERIWPRLVRQGRDDTITAVAWLNNWGMALAQLGRPLEAEKLLRRSIEIHRTDASDAAVSPMVMTNYSQQLLDIARVPEAQDYAERALQTASRAGDEIVINQTLLRLSRIYRAQHEYDRALAMLDQVEPRLRKALPPGHYAFSTLTSERSLIAQQQGDFQRALDLANTAIALDDASSKDGKTGAQYLPILLSRRAAIEMDGGLAAPAEHDARHALALLESAAAPGDFSTFTGQAYLVLARALSAQGRQSEARSAALRAADQLEKAAGPTHPDTRTARELARAAD